LRVGEALLARTAPPGQAGAYTGSLAGRLLAERTGPTRVLGGVLLVLVPVVGLAYYGGAHGEAVADAAGRLLPGSAVPLVLAVAGFGAVLSLVPLRKAGAVLGWMGLVALVTFFGAALVAFFAEPSRAFGGFGRALLDAFEGAPSSGAFSGATVGEIAFAAMLHLLPPLASTGGVEGALHAEAQASTTKQHAASALLGPLLYVLLTTVLGISFVSTGAFSRPIDGERAITDLRSYSVAFDTVSQREESDRLYTGILRIREGSTGAVQNELATERGMVQAPRFYDRGRPADVMIRYRAGEAYELQKPSTIGALEMRPLSELDQLVVRGRMLPRGGSLLAEAMSRGGGSLLARMALAALLVLAALGAAAWGIAIARIVQAKLPLRFARWTSLIPAAGLALAAFDVAPWLPTLGAALAGLLTVASSLALLFRSKEIGQLGR
jgi:hypothetical protein